MLVLTVLALLLVDEGGTGDSFWLFSHEDVDMVSQQVATASGWDRLQLRTTSTMMERE